MHRTSAHKICVVLICLAGLCGCAFDAAPQYSGVDASMPDAVDQDTGDDASEPDDDVGVDVPDDNDPPDIVEPPDVTDEEDIEEPEDVPTMMEDADGQEDVPPGPGDVVEDEPDVQEPPDPLRVQEGLQVLYLFDDMDEEGTVTNHGPMANMDLGTVRGGLVTIPGYGATMPRATTLAQTDATGLIRAIKDNAAFTVELWVRPHNDVQLGPARILGIEQDSSTRNLTIGQQRGDLAIRLRTGESSSPNTVYVEDVFANFDEPVHVVMTYDGAQNLATVYANGNTTVLDLPDDVENPSISNWNDTYPFAVADLNVGGRPWLGDLYLAAIYDRVLSPQEIETNRAAGLDGEASPPPSVRLDVEATVSTAVEGGDSGLWTITREGDLSQPIGVRYMLLGEAGGDEDFELPSRNIVIEAGQESVTVPMTPIDDGRVEGEEAVIFQLIPTADYMVKGHSRAAIELLDNEVSPPTNNLEAWLTSARLNSVRGERIWSWPKASSSSITRTAYWGAVASQSGFITADFDGLGHYRLATSGLSTDEGLAIVLVLDLVEGTYASSPIFSAASENEDNLHFYLQTTGSGSFSLSARLEDQDAPEVIFDEPGMLAGGKQIVVLRFLPTPNGLEVLLRHNGAERFVTTLDGELPSVETTINRLGDTDALSSGARFKLYEFMLYEGLFGSEDLAQVEEYLSRRYGLF